jgi:AraC-like DNA-binding protein
VSRALASLAKRRGSRCYAAPVTRPLAIPGTISAVQIQPLVLALRELGVDTGRVLALAGTSEDAIVDPHARLPAGVEFAVWDAIVELTGDPLIGLKVAEQIKVGALGAYEYLLRNSSTFRASIERANRYERVVDDLTRISLIEDGPRCALRMWRVGGYPHPVQGVECLFAILVKMVAQELPSYPAIEARFSHQPACDPEVYPRYLGCPAHFAREHNEIVFPSAALDARLRSADLQLGDVLEEHVQRLLENLPKGDPFVQRARGALAAMLDNGGPALETLATRLHMSPRTLRRRLEEQGTSYKALLDDLRRELACHYLTRGADPFEQIATRLGFAEPSAFYRAFKRWTGTTPALYRTHHE